MTLREVVELEKALGVAEALFLKDRVYSEESRRIQKMLRDLLAQVAAQRARLKLAEQPPSAP